MLEREGAYNGWPTDKPRASACFTDRADAVGCVPAWSQPPIIYYSPLQLTGRDKKVLLGMLDGTVREVPYRCTSLDVNSRFDISL